MSEFKAGFDLEPELRGYYDEVLKISRYADDLVSGLTDTQLLWKPEPAVWSIAQNLAHLNASARTEFPSVHRAIAEGQPRRSSGHARHYAGLFGLLLIKVMGAPAKLKFKAPKAYLPDEHKTPGEIIREFFLVQQELLDCIRKANGLDLAGTKVRVLHYKRIRLSLGQDLKLFVVHEQRHLFQAQRIKNALVLP